MPNKLVILSWLIACLQVSNAQPSAFLKAIDSLQIREDSFYNSGLFPSQVTWKKGKRTAEDDNIFFTAITLYTLQSIYNKLTVGEQVIADSIHNRAIVNLRYYRNRSGELTYNFYQVNPENPFPNVKFMGGIFNTKLPDDLDDTAMIYLLQNNSDSINTLIKHRMASEVAEQKKVKSTLREYKRSIAYRTWFADKMNQDIDICVISNVLLFVHQKGLKSDSIDNESIRLIKQMITKDEHIKNANLISPHYQSTPIILYHVARLIAAIGNSELNEIRNKVVNDLNKQRLLTNNEMEKVIILTSLYRLGERPVVRIDSKKLQEDMNKFYWFKANLTSGRPVWIRRLMGNSEQLLYKYKSEAYYWSLVLELNRFLP